MRVLLLAASALAAMTTTTILPAVQAATPTAYIDIHQITSFTNTGSIERGFLFRAEASESNFAGSPPKGPKWSTKSALTGGAGKNPDHLKHATKQKSALASNPTHRLMLPPDSDPYLCNEARGVSDYLNPAGNAASGAFDPDTLLSGYENNYVLVPRGRCTFEAKARSAQRLGAAGAVVRNTLESRYRLIDEDASSPSSANSKNGPDWSNTEWPVDRRDYECGVGQRHAADGIGWRAEIDPSSLNFSPAPYDGSVNDPLLTGPASDGSLCANQPELENFAKRCPSERCLLTGRNSTTFATDDDGTPLDGVTMKLEACCAWDSYVRMSTDGDVDGDAVPQEEEERVVIPALFVTMESGDELYDVVRDAEAQTGDAVRFVTIVPYGRWYPSGHYSSIVVWALALFTLWIASYESAKEYRTSWKKIGRAVNDGVVVFQTRGAATATASSGTSSARRERAGTEDTADSADEDVDFELAPEVELATLNGDTSGDGDRQENGGENGVAASSPDDGSFTISDDAEADDFVGHPTSSSGASSFAPVPVAQEEPRAAAPADAPQGQQQQRENIQTGSNAAAMEKMEINLFHAVLFVVCASGFLFVLFFFNLDKIIRVLYGLGGSMATNQVIFRPGYASQRLPGGIAAKLRSNAFGNLPGCRGEYFKWMDVVSAVTAYSLGIAWIVIGLTRVSPMTSFYYWFLQDVMGVCFCILILGLIHINSIMVASVLLSLVFVYDVFYVLISPLIFGSSVMIDVATGANGMDPAFCEKYPSDRACRGALAPLPMLLAVPWFNDFRGGFSMLGLGDIVLPGLLVSFAARYDSAMALVRKCTRASNNRVGDEDGEIDATVGQVDGGGSGANGSSSSSKPYRYQLGRMQAALFRGYLGPLVIAYGVGLIVAYLVVWATKTGQPALLYLVPACLGTVLFLGWRRRELSELWSGPKVMMKANRMVAVAAKIPEPTSAATVSLPQSSTIV